MSLTQKNLILYQGKDKNYSVQLQPIENKNHNLYLDFENKQASALKDRSNQHKILVSNYIPNSKYYYQGKISATCLGKSSQIQVEANEVTILGSKEIYNQIFISLALYPKSSKGIIFSKIYFFEGKRYGMKLKMKNYQLSFDIYNLFTNNQKTYSAKLIFSRLLERNKWNQIQISIDTNTKEIFGFLNGQRTAFQEVSKKYNITNFGFHQNDTSPLILCNNYYGYLDDFLLGIGKIKNLKQVYPTQIYDTENKTLKNVYGTALSPVYQTKYSHSIVENLAFNYLQPKETKIEFYIRFSEKYFESQDQKPIWKDIISFKEKKKRHFRYFQWKMKLKSDYKGEKTPEFYSFRLKYRETKPPLAPNDFNLVLFDPRKLKICFQWSQSHEVEVREGGGYKLHYGVSPERMVYSLSIFDVKKRQSIGNIEFFSTCLDNEILLKNVNKQKNLGHNILLLKKGGTYYFKISVYNKYYDETERKDQISKQSPAVSVTFLSE